MERLSFESAKLMKGSLSEDAVIIVAATNILAEYFEAEKDFLKELVAQYNDVKAIILTGNSKI